MVSKSIIFLFVIAFISLISINCNSFVCENIPAGSVEIGKELTFCLHFFPLYQKIAFKVKVDDYAILTVTGGYMLVSASSFQTTSFIAQLGEVTSMFPTTYYDRTNNYVIPLFNIVIKVDKGVITEIFWDNGCFDCNADDTCKSHQETKLDDLNITFTEEVN